MSLNNRVRTFQELDVYKRLYNTMISVMTKVLPKLPHEERFDLVDQMRRASKAPLAIIAEGYAKKNYKRDWQRYINDAIGECNEMITHLSCCRDVYHNHISKELINELINEYDISGKQLYRLGESWKKVE